MNHCENSDVLCGRERKESPRVAPLACLCLLWKDRGTAHERGTKSGPINRPQGDLESNITATHNDSREPDEVFFTTRNGLHETRRIGAVRLERQVRCKTTSTWRSLQRPRLPNEPQGPISFGALLRHRLNLRGLMPQLERPILRVPKHSIHILLARLLLSASTLTKSPRDTRV